VKRVLIGLVVLMALAAGFMAFKMMQPPPSDLDLSLQKPSDKGLYQVAFKQENGELAVGPITTFLVELKDAQGNPVEGAEIGVDGGMPQHGHGLPTSPKLSGIVGPGNYRIDGVKFSMGGWWQFNLAITSHVGEDAVTFNVVLE